MSPETWVMLPEILVMSLEKKKSNYMIDFYVAKVFMALLGTKKKFLKLTKCPWVRNEYIPNEQRFIFCQKRRTLPFVVRNEQRF